MIIFFVGILEMLIITIWTKVVTETRILASGVVTLINVLIWYYVLQTLVKDINNIFLVLLYASGCVLGTILGTYFFHLKEKAREKEMSKS